LKGKEKNCLMSLFWAVAYAVAISAGVGADVTKPEMLRNYFWQIL
jgi:hypothetical protein